MKLVVFSLWGTDAKYTEGAMANVKLAKEIYPDWHCMFFVDNLFSPVADQLMFNGAIVTRFPFENVGRYYWRHCIPDVAWRDSEYYIVRDCDSRLTAREKSAVDAWIASGRTYHFMHDHPRHTCAWMQGMYGVKGYALRGITSKLRCVPDEYAGINPLFDEWYAAIKPEERLVHGEFNPDTFKDQVPFPTAREGKRFVGEIYNANGEPNGDCNEIL